MRILVADGVASQRDATVKLLSAAGHKVETASTVAETEAALAKNRYDVFITEADFPERPAEGQSVVKRFRAAEKEGHLYILMLSAQMTPMRIVQAFDVGCDDVARKPISAEELLARAGAIDRIRKWAGFLFKEEGNVDFAQKANLANMRAWKEAPHATATILAGMFNLVAKPIAMPATGPLTGAELSLVLSDDAGEVTLSVGCDAASLKELGELSLGSSQPTKTALGDMMKEIANTVGGALKRLSDADRIPMTIGLPKACETIEFKSDQAGSISSYAVQVGESIVLNFGTALRSRTAEWVAIKDLQENMVVVQPVLNNNGLTLVPAGSRLTVSGIEKLGRFMAVETLIQIVRV